MDFEIKKAEKIHKAQKEKLESEIGTDFKINKKSQMLAKKSLGAFIEEGSSLNVHERLFKHRELSAKKSNINE